MPNEEGKNYKVECRIDGRWFKNDLVWNTREEADGYGAQMIEAGGADKFRVIETTEPVERIQEAAP